VYDDSVDETGKERPDLEGDKADIKNQIRKKRRQGIKEAQFEEL